VKNSDYEEKWISYANEGYFSAKELSVNPVRTVTLKEPAAHSVIFIQGHGKFGPHQCEAPGMLRFGQQSADEYFVAEDTAKKGITITNASQVEPLVLIKGFGPNHPDAPEHK
jgi:hypothetical protein